MLCAFCCVCGVGNIASCLPFTVLPDLQDQKRQDAWGIVQNKVLNCINDYITLPPDCETSVLMGNPIGSQDGTDMQLRPVT